ncbi:MAG: radical SAM protein [Deltaproteobacteria bacterium]|nr:radical SAM protein [Deltaproteobacteria bacterium]
MPLRLLIADEKGTVLEHPSLLAAVRSGEEILAARDVEEKPIALPEFGKLAFLPGRIPVGIDPDSGEPVPVTELKLGSRTIRPSAVGALLPPGYTRTYLPAEVPPDGAPPLPQWAYTAAAWSAKGPVAYALHTDKRGHWDPSRYSTPDLKKLVTARLHESPTNKVLLQLKTCALLYRCTTSQNVFYERDEGAIPASVACNAFCVGCISEQPEDGPPASHDRQDKAPSGEEMADVAIRHLTSATGRPMISWGQGCEGEPLTRARAIEQAIRLTREKTKRGSLNINTNASRTDDLRKLFDAGLDAIRVSLNSADPELYAAYYNPVGYDWHDVERSVALAREKGAYLALNLLLFPGVTDREGEAEKLCELVSRYQVDQVQTRSLCIDPRQYLECADGVGAGGRPIGVKNLLEALKDARPGLIVGNFARGLDERENAAGARP